MARSQRADHDPRSGIQSSWTMTGVTGPPYTRPSVGRERTIGNEDFYHCRVGNTALAGGAPFTILARSPHIASRVQLAMSIQARDGAASDSWTLSPVPHLHRGHRDGASEIDQEQRD